MYYCTGWNPHMTSHDIKVILQNCFYLLDNPCYKIGGSCYHFYPYGIEYWHGIHVLKYILSQLPKCLSPAGMCRNVSENGISKKLVWLQALYILPLKPIQALLLGTFWMGQLPLVKLADLRMSPRYWKHQIKISPSLVWLRNNNR